MGIIQKLLNLTPVRIVEDTYYAIEEYNQDEWVVVAKFDYCRFEPEYIKNVCMPRYQGKVRLTLHANRIVVL